MKLRGWVAMLREQVEGFGARTAATIWLLRSLRFALNLGRPPGLVVTGADWDGP
jgi:hypothetical protein